MKKLLLCTMLAAFNIITGEAALAESTSTPVKVEFDYTGHLEERAIVRELYKKDIEDVEKIIPDKVDIGVFLYDLNGDGRPEIITVLNSSGFCGSAGCAFKVLQQNQKKQWVVKFQVSVPAEGISILPIPVNGYRSFSFIGTGNASSPRIWHWNGHKYNLTN